MVVFRYIRYRLLFIVLGFLTAIILISSFLRYSDDLAANRTKEGLHNVRHVSLLKRSGGSRSYYNIPSVEALAQTYSLKQDSFGSKFVLRDSQPYKEFLKGLRTDSKRGALQPLKLENDTIPRNYSLNKTTSWSRFYLGVNQYELYDPFKSENVEELLRDLSIRPIISADGVGDHIQVRVTVTLDGGLSGLFKPRRYPKDYETPADLLYFSEMDRHNSEIAAFHLDRILGFHRALPTVGRSFNVTQDFQKYTNMFLFTSPAGNKCFLVMCKLFIDGMCNACGNVDVLEGSLTVSLPERQDTGLMTEIVHPWSRSYNTTQTAWELDDGYCESQVSVDPRFKTGRTLLDLIDMAVFDFLIGNMDRSHFGKVMEFGEDSFVFHVDNSKGWVQLYGFGKANYDCTSCLAPLRQCCQVRLSTLAKLIKLYQGPDSLSQVMRTSLNSDPLSPVLPEPHLDALDRRLGKVIKAVSDCIQNGRSWEDVVIDDGLS